MNPIEQSKTSDLIVNEYKTDIPKLKRRIQVEAPVFAVSDDGEVAEIPSGPWHEESIHLELEEGHNAIPINDLEWTDEYYNEQGLIIERRRCTGDNVVQRERFVYDSAGRLYRMANEDLVGESVEKEERTYNGEGKLVKRTVTYMDDTQLIVDHLWSNAGMREEILTRNDGELESREITLYDQKGRVIEEMDVDLETGMSSGSYYVYDSDDRIIEIGWIDENGTRSPTERTRYDADGRLLHRETEVDDTEYEYENGLLIRERSTGEDTSSLTEYEYDSQGRLTHQVIASDLRQEESIIVYGESGYPFLEAYRLFDEPAYRDRVRGQTVSMKSTWTQYEFFT